MAGSRRARNPDLVSTINVTGPTTDDAISDASSDAPEPFPALSPGPTSPNAPPSTTQDYFSHPPATYRVNPRSIGLRRLESADAVPRLVQTRSNTGPLRRRRGDTAPSRDQATTSRGGEDNTLDPSRAAEQTNMDTIVESHDGGNESGPVRRAGRRLRAISDTTRSAMSRMSDERSRSRQQTDHYEDSVVDYLDVLDPEVSTLTTLTNVQNSLFVPEIPFLNRYINRRPTYQLTKAPTRISESPEISLTPVITRRTTRRPVVPESVAEPVPTTTAGPGRPVPDSASSRLTEPARRTSITSILDEKHYAVLPHGVTLEDWSQEDVDLLDDYVRHMLHSRRSRFKRSMKGFGKYIRKPLGFFVTLYAFLITVFGTIWVLFLIGWISLGERKDYIVNIIDNVLVALFAIMGDGLAPFRIVDTYHMIYIAHYHRLSWRIRKQRGLAQLDDQNDLPETTISEVKLEGLDLEKAQSPEWHFSVLTQEQQKKLIHHQNQFCRSHSYYRPHETTTHHAFPLKLLITIVSLLDAHSTLQIMLGCFTWAWSYHSRPGWITAVILSFSITVNITAGVLISVGDKRTRKKDVILRMARQGLTEEAMRKVVKKHRGANKPNSHVQPAVTNAVTTHHQVHAGGATEEDKLRTNSHDSDSSSNGTGEKTLPNQTRGSAPY